MAWPFLEILTRCYLRPQMLAVNQASLREQTSRNWTQTLLVDEVGRGVPWAQENLGAYAGKLVGEYVWILDDDDVCTRTTFVAEMEGIVREHDPDVIMVKMDHGPRGILPDIGYWMRPPVHAHVGCSAYVVRRRIWQEHAGVFCPGTYYSDFNFIRSIFDHEPVVYWHNVIASRVQRISLGEPEGGAVRRPATAGMG